MAPRDLVPPPGLALLDLRGTENLVALYLLEGLWSLRGLVELHLDDCGLGALSDGGGRLSGLRVLRPGRQHAARTKSLRRAAPRSGRAAQRPRLLRRSCDER